MNFLRNIFSNKDASSSEQSVQSTAAPILAEEILPEFEFSSDACGSQLNQLWSKFESSPKGDQSLLTLAEFVDVFESVNWIGSGARKPARFSDLMPHVLDLSTNTASLKPFAAALSRCASVPIHGDDVSNAVDLASAAAMQPEWSNSYQSRGHPSRLIQGLKREFTKGCLALDKQLLACFEQCISVDAVCLAANRKQSVTVSSSATNIGAFCDVCEPLLIMHLLLIVTKFAPNRAMLRAQKFHAWVVKLLKIVNSRYESLWTKHETASPIWLAGMQEYLESLLLCCIRLCIQLIDPWQLWRALPLSSYSNGIETSGVLRAASNDQWRANVLQSPIAAMNGAQMLAESGLPDVLSAMLLRSCKTAASGQSELLMKLILECTGSMCRHHSAAQGTLLQSGALDAVCELAGWPESFSAWQEAIVSHQAGDSSAWTSMNVSVDSVFQKQMLVVQVVSAACHGRADIVEHVQRSGFFDRCVDVFLWISMVSTQSKSVVNAERLFNSRLPQSNLSNSPSQAKHDPALSNVHDEKSVFDEFVHEESQRHRIADENVFHLLAEPALPRHSGTFSAWSLHQSTLFDDNGHHSISLPTCSPLQQLFDAILIACVKSCELRRTHHQRHVSQPTSSWLHQHLFQLQLDLFDESICASEHSQVARQFLRDGVPILQLYSIRWWMLLWQLESNHVSDKQHAREATDLLEWIRSKPLYTMWLVSPAFLDATSADEQFESLVKASDDNTDPGSDSGRPRVLPPFGLTHLSSSVSMPPAMMQLIERAQRFNRSPDSSSVSCISFRSGLYELCQSAALQLVSHIATDPLTVDTSVECQTLLSVLESHSNKPDLVVSVVCSLIEWIRLRRNRTHRSLLRANVWSTISRLITTQQQHQLSLAQPSAASQHFAARCAVLKLVDFCLCAREMRMLALRESYVINTLCSLLIELPIASVANAVPLLRGFALRILTDLMLISHSHVAGGKTATDSSGDSDKRLSTKVHLFVKFIEMLPKFSDDFELSRGLLHGLRRVLSLSKNSAGHSNRSSIMQVDQSGSQFTVVNGQATNPDAYDAEVAHAAYVNEKSSEFGNDIEANQNMMRDQNALARVVALLDLGDQKENEDLSGRITLCVEVLRTLTMMMHSNAASKHHFREFVGYERLSKLLLRVEPQGPSITQFALLFVMMFDGEHVTASLQALNQLVTEAAIENSEPLSFNVAIQNPDVMNVIFALLAHSSPSLRTAVVRLFVSLMDRHTLNQSYACAAGLVDAALDLFPRFPAETRLQRSLIALIERVGAHSMSVKQLKRYFSLMKSTNGDEKGRSVLSRPWYNPLLLTALQNMKCKDRPSSFFFFDGINSGLELPSIDYFPSARGYTFATWLRIESYDHPHASLPQQHGFHHRHQPRLLSMLAPDGSGLEIFFHLQRLTVQVTLEGKVYTETMDFQLKPRVKFYHLVVTHKVAPTFGSPELRIYVDTKLRCAKPLKYPKFKDTLQKCFIGTNDASPRPHALFAQLSSIYFFDDVLNDKQVESLFWLKSSYSLCFQASEAAHHSPACAPILNGSLTDKICFAYNARACDGDWFLDNAPENGPRSLSSTGPQIALSRSSTSLNLQKVPTSASSKVRVPMHARRLPGTHQCSTRDINDMMDCMGGIRVLFPIFVQLDQPIKGPDGALSYDVDADFLVQLLGLICDMIYENPSNQKFMADQGFGVIAHLLSHVSPEHLSVGALDAIERLVASVSYHTSLYQHAFLSLLFPVEIWIYATPAVREAWANRLLLAVRQRPGLFRQEILGVVRVCDALRSVCWFSVAESGVTPAPRTGKRWSAIFESRKPLENLSQSTTSPSNSAAGETWLEAIHQRVYHAVQNRVVGGRPSTEGAFDGDEDQNEAAGLESMRQFRHALLRLVVEMVGESGPSQAEVEVLMSYVLEVKEDRQRVDILGLLLFWADKQEWLERRTGTIFRNSVILHLLSLDAINLLLSLLSSTVQAVRVLTLELLSRLLPNYFSEIAHRQQHMQVVMATLQELDGFGSSPLPSVMGMQQPAHLASSHPRRQQGIIVHPHHIHAASDDESSSKPSLFKDVAVIHALQAAVCSWSNHVKMASLPAGSSLQLGDLARQEAHHTAQASSVVSSPHRLSVESAHMTVVGRSSPFASTHSFEASASRDVQAECWFASVLHALSEHEFSEFVFTPLYATLLGVVRTIWAEDAVISETGNSNQDNLHVIDGVVSAQSSSNASTVCPQSFYRSSQFSRANLNIDAPSVNIHQPAALHVIFKLLTRASPSLVLTVLQDMMILLHEDHNADAFLGSFGWQSWLLDILLKERAWRLQFVDPLVAAELQSPRQMRNSVDLARKLTFGSVDECAEDEISQAEVARRAEHVKQVQLRLAQSDTIVDMCLKLFSLLMCRVLRTRFEGWCFFSDTLAWLQTMWSNAGADDVLLVAGALLRDIVVQVKRCSESEESEQTSFLFLENLANVLCVAENFLLSRAETLATNTSSEYPAFVQALDLGSSELAAWLDEYADSDVEPGTATASKSKELFAKLSELKLTLPPAEKQQSSPPTDLHLIWPFMRCLLDLFDSTRKLGCLPAPPANSLPLLMRLSLVTPRDSKSGSTSTPEAEALSTNFLSTYLFAHTPSMHTPFLYARIPPEPIALPNEKEAFEVDPTFIVPAAQPTVHPQHTPESIEQRMELQSLLGVLSLQLLRLVSSLHEQRSTIIQCLQESNSKIPPVFTLLAQIDDRLGWLMLSLHALFRRHFTVLSHLLCDEQGCSLLSRRQMGFLARRPPKYAATAGLSAVWDARMVEFVCEWFDDTLDEKQQATSKERLAQRRQVQQQQQNWSWLSLRTMWRPRPTSHGQTTAKIDLLHQSNRNVSHPSFKGVSGIELPDESVLSKQRVMDSAAAEHSAVSADFWSDFNANFAAFIVACFAIEDQQLESDDRLNSEYCSELESEPSFAEWISVWSHEFACSPKWTFVRNERLPALVRETYQEQRNTIEELVGHFNSSVSQLKLSGSKFVSYLGKAQEQADKTVMSAVDALTSPEKQRRSDTWKARQRVRAEAAASWQDMARALTNERAPWFQHDGRRVFWQLDMHQNLNRMRCKLKIDYAGTDHRSAVHPSAGKHHVKNRGVSVALDASAALSLVNSPEVRTLLGLSLRGALKTHSTAITTPTAAASAAVRESPGAASKESAAALAASAAAAAAEAEAAATASWRNGSRVRTVEMKYVRFSTPCAQVSPLKVVNGRLYLTASHLYFVVDDESTQAEDPTTAKYLLLPPAECQWRIAELVELHFRRHQLIRNSLELFLADRTHVFFTFFREPARDTFFKQLMYTRPPNMRLLNTRNPTETLQSMGLTELWQRRKISNFDYLMMLNIIAGRTYNDLSQYPVFPWILADYESAQLDLSDPRVYRDLSKPVGALNEDKIPALLKRYDNSEDFENPELPKYHYGSHYSNPGFVLFYLLRLEPYTTLAIQLQGGHFDHADRLFDSLPQAWHGVLSNHQDVKELIPEFFFLPEIFKNTNGLDLGTKQSTKVVGDVVLPPWAATAEDFIRIHREALESEHVSRHLHQWIDLVFGYQQRGQAAIDALNVFHYATYEGILDLDSMAEEDPVRFESTKIQINEFGQTPTQIMMAPHPPRNVANELSVNIFDRIDDLKCYSTVQLTVPRLALTGSSTTVAASGAAGAVASADSVSMLPSSVATLAASFVADLCADNALLFVHALPDRLISIALDRTLGLHGWRAAAPEYVPPFLLTVDSSLSAHVSATAGVAIDSSSVVQRKIGTHFSVHVMPSSSTFAVSRTGKYVLSCQHWDGTFKLSRTDTGALVQSIGAHKDTVTCVAIDSIGNTEVVVTGSKDATVMVWNMTETPAARDSLPLDATPRHILHGHDDEVTSVAVNQDFDAIVSASLDGTLIQSRLRAGEYVRTIVAAGRAPLHAVKLSKQGHILSYSLVDRYLRLYSINGVPLAQIDAKERIYSMAFSDNGHSLVTGSDRRVLIRRTHDLGVVRLERDTRCPVRALSLTADEQHLLVGLQSGQLMVCALDAKILRERTLQKLTDLGF